MKTTTMSDAAPSGNAGGSGDAGIGVPTTRATLTPSGTAGTRKLRPVPGAVLANTADTVAALGPALVQADHVAKRFQELVQPAISKPRWCSQCKSHLRAYKRTNFCSLKCAIAYRRHVFERAQQELNDLLAEAAEKEQAHEAEEADVTLRREVECIKDFLGIGSADEQP